MLLFFFKRKFYRGYLTESSIRLYTMLHLLLILYKFKRNLAILILGVTFEKTILLSLEFCVRKQNIDIFFSAVIYQLTNASR